MPHTPLPERQTSPVPVVFTLVRAAVAGGMVDVVYATARGLTDSGSALTPWRGVASGWIGRGAYGDSLAPVGLGLATHFGIAAVMAAVWIWGLNRITIVRSHRLVSAALYGLGLYVAMYLIVLPSRWPTVFPRWEGVRSVLDILAHVAVAQAIAWAASRTPSRAFAP